jgi:hypothetical protein
MIRGLGAILGLIVVLVIAFFLFVKPSLDSAQPGTGERPAPLEVKSLAECVAAAGTDTDAVRACSEAYGP